MPVALAAVLRRARKQRDHAALCDSFRAGVRIHGVNLTSASAGEWMGTENEFDSTSMSLSPVIRQR